jgi:hypothetical protein
MPTPPLNIKFTSDLVPKNLGHNLQHIDAALDKALQKYMERAKQVGVSAATKKIRPHNYTGALERSVRNDSRADKNGVSVGSNLSYAAFQDGATKRGMSAAGWPNVQSLRGWVQKRLQPASDTELSAITYLIGRSISKRGKVKNPIRFMEAAEKAIKTEVRTTSMRRLKEDIYKAVNR